MKGKGRETVGIEREWKFRATPKLLDELEETFRKTQKSKEIYLMETTYLDTAEREFARRKWTLRVRKENDAPVVTLKTPAENGARGEWEHAGSAPDAEKLLALGAPEELKTLLQKPLQATCGARFLRRAISLELPKGGLAELALDAGVLFRETRETPLCEVEIEHKRGSAAETEALAMLLKARYALEPEPESKFVRAAKL